MDENRESTLTTRGCSPDQQHVVPVGLERGVSSSVGDVRRQRLDNERVVDAYRMFAEAQLSSFVSRMLRPAAHDPSASRDATDLSIMVESVARILRVS